VTSDENLGGVTAMDTTTILPDPTPRPSLGAGPDTATATIATEARRGETGSLFVAALIGGLALLLVELRRPRSRGPRRPA
jgi:hypothetical protein